VVVDEGQVAAARINLAYTRITSPIAGRAGVRLVDPGNLVSASGSIASTPNTSSATSSSAPSGTAVGAASTTASGGASAATTNSSGSGIVVINQIQPIAVTFTVPQGQFHRLVNLSNGFTRPLAVRAYDQDTDALLDSGQVTIADNRVDAATGTVQLKAEFPNAGRRLWPGEFVNVKLTLQTLRNATLIPSAAVNRGPNGLFAFVIGANNHVVLRPLAVVATQGAVAILKSGVRPGELVVTDGQMTLKNGSLVHVSQTVPIGSAAP
jgi:multidrug efflux system membrane fusion protein